MPKARRRQIKIPEELFHDFLRLPKLDTLHGVGTPIDLAVLLDQEAFKRIRFRFAVATEEITEMGTVKIVKLTAGETKFLSRMLLERLNAQQQKVKNRTDYIEANDRKRVTSTYAAEQQKQSDAVLRKQRGYHQWEIEVCLNMMAKLTGGNREATVQAYNTWQEGKARKDEVQTAVGHAAFHELIYSSLERDETEIEL